MGLDNKLIFPETLSVQVSDQEQVIEYTREETGEINLIEGNSKLVDTEIISVGKLNEETSKYDINITTSKEINDHTLKSIKTISLDEPLRGIGNIKDMIYKYSDTDYYLYRKIGTRSYRVGDENDESVITDLTTTLYDLGIAGYYENKINFDNKIQFYGTNTTFECDSMMPNLTMTAPIDYAYNESKRKYRDEEIIIDEVDIDDRKDIDILSIEGQTFENLLQEPLVQGTAINPVELTGRECVYTGGENTTIPLREITGDTYVNLLEDKIENTTIKPVASYNGDVVDGTRYKKEFIMNDMDTGMISRKDGITIEENSVWRFDPYYYKIANMELYIKFKANASTSICFYDIDKKFISIHSDSFNKITETKLTIPQNAIFVRFCWHSGAGDGSYVIFDKIPYNLGDYDKVIIDEIRGNTKVYNQPIPIADYKTNAFCCDLVLQSIDNEGVQDLNKKQFLGSSDYIYIKDFSQEIYVRVYEKGSTIPKGFGVTWYKYDDNLKYIGKSGWAIDDSARPMNIPGVSYIKFVLTNNNEEVEHQEGIYEVVISDTKPTGYIEPTILGPKTFPIQSVGELYVDEEGEPILDDDNNEQYKVNIISSNNIWDGKKFNTKYSNGASGFGDPSDYNSVKLQDNYSMKITKSQATTRFYSGTIIVDNILNYSKLYASCRYINDNGLKNNSQIWWCDFYDVSGNYLSQARQSMPTNSSNLYQASFDVPSGAYTARWAMQGDINEYISAEFYITDIKITYNKEKTVTPITTTIESILLPQPLRSHIVKDGNGNELYKCCDRLYWDNEKNKYCIEKNIISFKTGNINYTGQTNIEDKGFSSELRKIKPSSANSTFMYEGCQYLTWGSSSLNTPNIIGVKRYHDASYFRVVIPNNMSNEVVSEILSNKVIYGELKESEIIETNITEKIVMQGWNDSTCIYTRGVSSHDRINQPYIDDLRGEITCTTLPLSTTAYIKPNTKYTMFMDTDCKVNYNLGGIDGDLGTKEYRLNWTENITLAPDTALEVSNGVYSTTNFISINKSFYKLTRSTGGFGAVYKYNSNKEFIERIVLTNIRSLDIDFRNDSNVKFIRIVEEKSWYNSLKLAELINYSNGKFVKVLTTPTTLLNNSLTLLGEGNIGNVTLLEGDYTNSYVPDTFINDVFSVGELQEDGSYKVDVVSRNNNLVVFNNIEISTSSALTILKNTEEKSIELKASSGMDLLTKTNINFKAGTTYTLSIKIETNNTNTSARIILIDDINKQNSFGGNATTVVSISNPATTKTITTTFTPNVDSCLFLNLNNYSNLSSETYMKFSEIIVLEGNFNEQDINYYEGKHEVKSISLPQPLHKVGNVCDRFYWDETRGKMCIEKNVAEIDFSNFDFSPCPYISGKFQITVPNMITGEGSLICNSIKAYGTNHGDLHGDTTDSNGYIVGAVAIGSDKCIILRLGKGMTKDDTIQWLINHNTKIYHRISPEIIETDITEPIEIDIFDADTTITTTSTVKPNFHLKSFLVATVPVNIKPSTKYYVFADVAGITTVNLGGSEIRYNTNDSCLEITTPSIVNENTISFIGDYSVSNVMLRTDNRLDIKYFFGKVYASAELEDGSYETVITANPMNGEEPTIVKIITSSPLKANTSITHIGDGYKYINELGEEEDVIINGIIPTSNSFNSFRAEGTVPAITNVIIPYRSIRPLKAPVNLAFNNYTDNDSHTFTWTTDVGVEGHKFYYKDELVATIDSPNPTYTYPSEMEGDVKIVAFNTLTESQGAVEDIITLPNRSEVVALNTTYDNGYKFTIDFNDNSDIRKGYKFIYSVDDGEENIIDIPVSDKAITLSQSIDVSEVYNNMKVRINSYNSVGEAEMKEKVFYLTPTPKWTYLLSSDNLMFRHQDKFPFTTYYKIKATNTQTLEEKEYNYGSNQGINGLIIDYLLKSNREEELSIMLTMNDGYLDHVPCVPFKVSKTLDLSLVAPQNFTMEWVGDGVAKFSWDDNYTNEDYFEFVYSLNGGIEEVVKIYPDDVAGTGGRISYTYEFDGFGILTGRVRMVWELNTSEYTDSKTATFVAVTGLPPAWIVKEYSGDNLVITWEAQSYVDHYEIMIECDGEVEILTEKKDMFYLDLKKYHGKYVSISIKTHFTTGLVTEYSDSILFKPVSTSGITNQMTYAPIKVEKDDNVSVYTKLADRYTSYQRITGLITNSNLLYNKFCKDMLTNSASFNNVFYHLVNHEYKDFVSVKTDNVSIESLIRILNYAHINQDGHLNTFVYTPITSSHTDFVDIQKVTIVCIGDSITSGHPGFWE